MYEFEFNDEILELMKKTGDTEKMADVLSYIWEECKNHNLSITDYRWKSLVNHIAAMTERAGTGEELEGIDIEMFSEISENSLALAKGVTDKIGNLQENETFLLSVHFEAAK